MTDGAGAPTPERRQLSGGLLIGLGFLGLAAFVGTGALAVGVTPSYSRVGPGVFPAAVAAGLAAIGIAMIAQALMGRWTTDWDRAHKREPHMGRLGRAALAWVALGLVLDLLLLESGGFVIASAMMFACTARAFGSRKPLRDAVLGLLLGGAIFAVFAYGLQVRLPAGWLWTSISPPHAEVRPPDLIRREPRSTHHGRAFFEAQDEGRGKHTRMTNPYSLDA